MARKKKKKIPHRPQVLTFEDFNADEMVWAAYLDGSVIEGKIVEFYPKDDQGPAVIILTRERGYRACRVANIRRQSISRAEAKEILLRND